MPKSGIFVSSSAWIVGPLWGDLIEIFVNKARAIAAVLSVVIIIALAALIGSTRLGKALRASADDPTAATYIGINVDFSHRMLSLGQKKFANHNVAPIEADALHLPLADASVDLVTSAFGFRNLANYEEGLAEIFRVLRPGGQLGILECNQPEGLTGAVYNIYFRSILPRLGGLITGNAHAYSYLNASVERFPRPRRMIELLRNAGFDNPTWTSYTFGVVGLEADAPRGQDAHPNER